MLLLIFLPNVGMGASNIVILDPTPLWYYHVKTIGMLNA